MTPRENFIAFLKKEPYEWTPTSMDQLPFRPSMIPDHIARAMVAEQKRWEGAWGGKDLFGVDWVYVPTVGGSMEVAPLFDDIEDWEKYVKFPNLDDLDWEGCAKENAEFLKTDKIIHSTIFTGYFERLISFIGFENSAMALIDEDQQEIVHKLFSKLTDLYIDEIHRLHKYFNVEIVEVHDDWGNQRSLMFSVDTQREMIMPYIQKIVEAAHAEGVFIEQHSCGKIETLLPNIIESGVDTWRGQGNVVDKKMLVDTYGDQFRFGVDVRPAEGLTYDQVMDFAKGVMDEYTGKDVWLVVGRGLPGDAGDAIQNMVRARGHI